MPSKTLRSEKLDLRLTRKGNARMPHCARNSYKISKAAAHLRRARISAYCEPFSAIRTVLMSRNILWGPLSAVPSRAMKP